MSKKSNRHMGVRVIKGEAPKMIRKALETKDASDTQESLIAGLDAVIPSPYPIKDLQGIIEISTILQQCIEAYKRNIVGFGLTPKYLEDDVVGDENPDMKAEWTRLEEFIKYFNFDRSFEDVMGEVIDDREQTGNGYIEIIRDGAGLPVEGERINPAYMRITKFTEQTEVTFNRDGKTFNRKRKFRKYVQEIGTSKVFFKEFGDPRKMDSRSGEFVDSIELEHEANEIIHLKIGSTTYGVPRWIGQLIHMYGARKAEELNYNYFSQGRHTPMAILLHNAVLSPDSEASLKDYANSIQGVDNAHKFLLIEAEGLDEGLLDDEKKNAKVELKSLADMLQQDALFLEYDAASREKVQSSFRLPDIYVGRSKDFNRATADTARYITEEQVFEPERNSLEWVINNKLLLEYELKHCATAFKKPEISDAEQVVKVIDAANKAGAIAPNDIRDVVGKYLGKDLENFEGDEYDLPAGAVQAQAQVEGMKIQNDLLLTGSKQEADEKKAVKKAIESDDFMLVMKDMRDVLEEQSAVIKSITERGDE